MSHRTSREHSVLRVHDLSLDAPGGRPLIRNLNLSLEATERVALVGRNGVGKSTLLAALANDLSPSEGRIVCGGSLVLVPQELAGSRGGEAPIIWSPGEARRKLLMAAFDAKSDFLLLDEPTRDLDRAGIEWLADRLAKSKSAVIVASHNRRILGCFRDFFVIAESGCRHFSGDFDSLMSSLSAEQAAHEGKYVRSLNHLSAKESRSATDRRRRQRKKHLGRVREVGRSQSRIKLNAKRSYAQEKQGKRWVRREARIAEVREWAKSSRRALAVTMPLNVAIPALPDEPAKPIADLESVAALAGERVLFSDISLQIRRERISISGPNGSGKSTLVEILTGDRGAQRGRATRDSSRIGYIAQNSRNWCIDESVIDHLDTHTAASKEQAAQILRAHHFPLALAARPLETLRPGERVRAALICLLQRRPVPELLILDEPTDHLDLLAAAALEAVLNAWSGGLIVVSHDEAFLAAIGLDERLELTGN